MPYPCLPACLNQPDVAAPHKLLQHSSVLQLAIHLHSHFFLTRLAVQIVAVQRASLSKQPALLSCRQLRVSHIAAGGHVRFACDPASADAKQKHHLGHLQHG